MLSILIPTYNYNTYPLAKELEKQALQAGITFELICIDDGSFSILNEENQKINSLTNCTFIENKKNIGRTANRQLLANKAQYNWLLFIDADVIPKHSNYLNTYIDEQLDTNFEAIFGGFSYEDDSFNKNSSLRFKFGKKREEIPATVRAKSPYKVVISANMLIKKNIFLKLNKVETGNMYGLDYLFGSSLKTNKISVKHIDNEVYHYGIETNEKYLNKTKKAVESLNYLIENKKIKSNEISLLKAFNFLALFRLNKPFGKFINIFHKKIESNLYSSNPSLFIFDIYRLGYFCRIH